MFHCDYSKEDKLKKAMRLAVYRLLVKTLPHLQRLRYSGNSRESLTFFPWTFQRHMRLLSTFKQSIISDLSLDIDIDGLKIKKRLNMRQGNNNVSIHQMVAEQLEEKCRHLLESLSDNPEQSKFLKVAQLEHSHLAAEGYSVLPPDEMTSKNWVEALTCSSSNERLTYFLFIGHKTRKKNEAREAERKKRLEEGTLDGETHHGIIYADEERLKSSRRGNYSLASAMTLGQPLVIDMDYDDCMTSKEIGQTAKQVWMAYCANRVHSQPFHLILTGCPPTNSTYRMLQLRHLLDCDHFLATTTKESYLDMFSPSDIIYLSPHARQPVERFDPNAVYVLAAYSDMLSQKKMAAARAKEQNIKFQRLPIDENIKWQQGNKDLFLNVVMKILLSIKDEKKWKDAFTNTLNPKLFKHH